MRLLAAIALSACWYAVPHDRFVYRTKVMHAVHACTAISPPLKPCRLDFPPFKFVPPLDEGCGETAWRIHAYDCDGLTDEQCDTRREQIWASYGAGLSYYLETYIWPMCSKIEGSP